MELKDITKDNWLACVRLKVREDQKDFVAPNAFSLVEAHYDPIWRPQAIYDGETMVGFVMYSREADPKWGWWILRLMVDQGFQGRGHGRAAVEEVLRRLKAEPGCREVFISEVPQNTVAAALYESIGFVKTGDVVDGELVFKILFTDKHTS